MSRIRGSNTNTEIALRSELFRLGLRYRKSSKIFGRPDVIFPTERLVVFVDGCFWHGCPHHVVWPKNNATFWRKKILGNKARDEKVSLELERLGWTVVRIWEHHIRVDASQCALLVQRQLLKKRRLLKKAA